jgi:uncharacterized repeat protein (TIGR03943 family)
METNFNHTEHRSNSHPLQALILAALGLFFLQKIWSGTLFWYINQRFFILTLLAGAGFLALAQVISGVRMRGKAAPIRVKPLPEHDDREGVHPRAHTSTLPHSHPHTSTPPHSHSHTSPWALLLVALPVILGVLVPARPLGSSALANKGLNAAAPLTASAGDPVRLDIAPAERTVLDWVRAFNYEADPTVFAGQPADVVGFVFHDSRLGQTQFFAGRFAVSCCVADAAGIAVVVEWPEATALVDNSWVRVQGSVQVAELEGKAVPMIVAEAVTDVPAPEQPYLYP